MMYMTVDCVKPFRTLQEWLKHTLSSLSWKLSGGLDSPYKILPVIRPSDEVQFVFHRLELDNTVETGTQDDKDININHTTTGSNTNK